MSPSPGSSSQPPRMAPSKTFQPPDSQRSESANRKRTSLPTTEPPSKKPRVHIAQDVHNRQNPRSNLTLAARSERAKADYLAKEEERAEEQAVRALLAAETQAKEAVKNAKKAIQEKQMSDEKAREDAEEKKRLEIETFRKEKAMEKAEEDARLLQENEATRRQAGNIPEDGNSLHVKKRTAGRGRPRGDKKPSDREMTSNTLPLWSRSTTKLGINIWEAIPGDIEVKEVGWGLNWPWSDELMRYASTPIQCPAFKNNVPLFQYVLRYAIACRCNKPRPELPEDLEMEITSESEEAVGGEEEEQKDELDEPEQVLHLKLNPFMKQKFLEQLSDAVAWKEVDNMGKNLSRADRQKEWQSAMEPILESYRDIQQLHSTGPPRPTQSQQNDPSTTNPIKIFLKFIKNAANEKHSSSPALLKDDFDAIAKGWDKYAEKYGHKTCAYYLQQARGIRTGKQVNSMTRKEIEEWKAEKGDLRLYGSVWVEESEPAVIDLEDDPIEIPPPRARVPYMGTARPSLPSGRKAEE